MARAPKLNTESIKREIQADQEARKAKTAARRKEKADAAKAAAQAIADKTEAERVTKRTKAQEAEAKAALATMHIDHEALTESGATTLSFEDYLFAEGYDAQGFVRVSHDTPEARAQKTERVQTYFGPMLALREASKRYVTGKNGNPHNNDEVARVLDGLTREEVVTKIGAFLLAEKVIETANPYKTLNPGQQSMNLRNKLRGALRSGLVTMVKLQAFIKG